MPDRELVFNMENQEQAYWCWAANTVSISKYYVASSPHVQCSVVNHCLGESDCCINGNSGNCNVPYYLEDSLSYTDNLKEIVRDSLTLEKLKTEIDEGFVICVRIGWPFSGGHAVVIYGYNDTAKDCYLYIADPATGNSILKFDDFRLDYENVGGKWTDTYLTKPPGSTMIEFAFVARNILESALNELPSKLFQKFGRPPLLHENFASKSMAHRVFVVHFIDLKAGIFAPIGIGTRLLGQSESGTVIYEYNRRGSETHLSKVIYGNQYTAEYKEVLNNAVSSYINATVTYVLRVLKQPELGLEVIWLHRSQRSDLDLFFPVINGRHSFFEKSYDRQNFERILNREVNNYNSQMDKDGITG